MKKGIITTYVLVFGAVFLLLLSGLLGFISLQLRQTNQRVSWNEAFEIAEAGMNYYRWCLNNEVGQNCLTEKEYQDLAGNTIGKFSLQIDTVQSCGISGSTKIISTGWAYKFPNIKRKISVSYSRESVAKYSYILKSNVWVGGDHEIRGPFHSNGGIRMDGENQSLVTSAAPDGEWICTDSFGCSPCPTNYGCRIVGADCVCPGVFTTTQNSNPDLFSFPAASFPFEKIAVDLAQIKKLTKEESQGLYFGPSGVKGYRVVINEDKIKVWKVLSTAMLGGICTIIDFKIICDGDSCKPECSQCQGGKCVVRDPVIQSEQFLGEYPIPSDCGLIFFEDELWVGKVDAENKVKGKITIASADLIDSNKETNVWLQGNIEYLRGDGLDSLTIIAQHNNLIGLYSPDQMELRGVFVAQSGFFGRNHYPCRAYSPYCLREKLEIYGSIISSGRVGTQWISGSQIASGYRKRETYIDPYLLYNPPIFTPFISSQYKIINWEELR